MFNEYIKPLIVLTCICLFFSAALALVNSVTGHVIAEASEERAYDAMYEVLPEASGFEPIKYDYSADVNRTVRAAFKADNDAGYVFIAAANGYGGEIRIICSLDNEGRVIDVRTLSHTETAGIGTIIEQESFLAPFRGAGSQHGIDTVTGATVSTSAFIRALDGVFNVFTIMNDESLWNEVDYE